MLSDYSNKPLYGQVLCAAVQKRAGSVQQGVFQRRVRADNTKRPGHVTHSVSCRRLSLRQQRQGGSHIFISMCSV